MAQHIGATERERESAPARSREAKARAKLGEKPKRMVPTAPESRPPITISLRPYLSARWPSMKDDTNDARL
jgi:hypothetical protein